MAAAEVECVFNGGLFHEKVTCARTRFFWFFFFQKLALF